MKVFLDSIGCRLNQSEIERMALQFRSAGHEIVETAAEADLVVVNTCAVTTEAASDSRQKIRQAQRAGKVAIAATGCWVTLDPAGAAGLPAVEWVVANADKEHLVAEILCLPVEAMDLEPLARMPLPGIHQRTRAFIKVQDGCDNYCTYCVTRLARGKSHSFSVDEIRADIHRAIEGGAKEIVLTGVHLGSWGQDFDHPLHLKDLIGDLLKETSLARLRLSSLEPWDLDVDFFNLWHDPRLCPHLHLPLQSGSASVLRRMARKVTPASYAALIAAARAAIPDLAITTDVIAGFPGETEDEFQQSLELIRQLQFAAGHVFTYSPRPGTPAAGYANQVPPVIRKQRGAVLRAVFAEAASQYRARFVGRSIPVLWESASALGESEWTLEGLTGNDLRVTAVSKEKRWNQLDLVRLESSVEGGLQGEIV